MSSHVNLQAHITSAVSDIWRILDCNASGPKSKFFLSKFTLND